MPAPGLDQPKAVALAAAPHHAVPPHASLTSLTRLNVRHLRHVLL